jgi:hypothetical protein
MAIDALAREATARSNYALGGLIEPAAAAKIYSFSAAKPIILFVTSEIADWRRSAGISTTRSPLPARRRP